jgi:sugar/nucleoside kinase (ribokinase family)
MDDAWQGDANGWVTVLRKARAAGLVTNLELVSTTPARLAALVRPMLPFLDLVIVNDAEIGAIGGEVTVNEHKTDVEACVRAARKVLETGSARLVAVHFPAGAVAVTRGSEVVIQPSVRVPQAEVAGANGAGDAFAAGFVYGFHEGWDLKASLALAHAVAAVSLRSMSTSDAVEPWRDCLAMAEKWGWREGLD